MTTETARPGAHARVTTSLQLSGISYVINRPLLDGIDLELRAGELTALSGPSGSGKTTLLSVAGGLIEATTGTASYDGRPMWLGTGDPRPEVAFVLQVYGLVPILSARENVSIALRARGVGPREADEHAEAALARFHISDLGDRQVEELSGGQMQRVACARGLVVGADVLLADEPTSELDEGNRTLVLQELRREAERGAIVVVATHDPAVVDVCDTHYVLDEGRLVDHVEAVHLTGRSRPVQLARHAAPAEEPPPAEPEVEVLPAAPRHEAAAPEAPIHEQPIPEQPTPEQPTHHHDDADDDGDAAFRRPTP